MPSQQMHSNLGPINDIDGWCCKFESLVLNVHVCFVAESCGATIRLKIYTLMVNILVLVILIVHCSEAERYILASYFQ